ncbi:hypothetical protein K2X33_07490 [bacterium]|nr:hypothetical protein [bacterium]
MRLVVILLLWSTTGLPYSAKRGCVREFADTTSLFPWAEADLAYLRDRSLGVAGESVRALGNPLLGDEPSPAFPSPFVFGPELEELFQIWPLEDYALLDEFDRAMWVGRFYQARHLGESLNAVCLFLHEFRRLVFAIVEPNPSKIKTAYEYLAVFSERSPEALKADVRELTQKKSIPKYLRTFLEEYLSFTETFGVAPHEKFALLVLSLQGIFSLAD